MIGAMMMAIHIPPSLTSATLSSLRTRSTLIYMDSVTIVLPLDDFGAMYALAKIGGMGRLAWALQAYPGWAAIQSPVLDRISVFVLGSRRVIFEKFDI